MRISKKSLVLVVVLGAVSSVAMAQQAAPKKVAKPLTFEQKVELANRNAYQLAADTVHGQQSYLSSHGTQAAFRDLATAMISWEEKIAQGNDLFGSSDNTTGRITQAFRQYIIDDTQLHDQFAGALEQLQTKLLTDTYLLYRESGRNLSSFPARYPDLVLKDGMFRTSFQPLFRDAAQLAKSDWVRELAVQGGTLLTGSLARQAGEEAGFLEQDSWGSLLFELAVDALATEVVNELHDPAGDLAKRLRSDYDAICADVINGNIGFARICRYVTDQHIEFRMDLLMREGPQAGSSDRSELPDDANSVKIETPKDLGHDSAQLILLHFTPDELCTRRGVINLSTQLGCIDVVSVGILIQQVRRGLNVSLECGTVFSKIMYEPNQIACVAQAELRGMGI